MFNFIKKLWVRVTGLFIQAGDELVSNGPDAIKATYATAVQDATYKFREMQEGFALLLQQTNRIRNTIDQMSHSEAELASKVKGALTMAKAEPHNTLHKEAGSRYLARLEVLRSKKTEQQNELNSLVQMAEDYKTQLALAKDHIMELKQEKDITLAEFLSAQNTLRIEERLSGIAGDNPVDESLVLIKDKVQNLKAQAQALSTTRGMEYQPDMYAEIGAEKTAMEKFEQLLDSPKPLEVEDEAGEQKEERQLG